MTSSPKRKRHCSSSLVKAKRHCHRDCSSMGAESSLKSTRRPPSPSRPPPILWYHHGGFWLLEIAAKADLGKLYLPANHKTEELFRGSIACVGYSSNGCILFKDKAKKNQLSLLHPTLLSVSAVSFPPINGIRKALVLSHGFVALNSDRRLMFAKCGGAANSQFAELECQDHRRRTQLTQMIYINNCIYTVTGSALNHHIEAWDCSNSISGDSDDDGPKKVLGFEPTFCSHAPSHRATLHSVESQGELWLVAIRRPIFGSPILEWFPDVPVCSVYRMDFKDKKWVRVDSLSDHVLIITQFKTMYLSAKEFSQYERNSIYFRHYHIRGFKCHNYYHPGPIPKYHLVVFNMEHNSLKKLKTIVEE